MQALPGATPGPTTNHFSVAPFGERRATAEAPRSKATQAGHVQLQMPGPQDRKEKAMNAFPLVVAWLAVVTLVLIARGDYRTRKPIR
jgi:hypothetical protein